MPGCVSPRTSKNSPYCKTQVFAPLKLLSCTFAAEYIFKIMKDSLFIDQMLEKGRQAGEIVKREFSNLSLQQLNWKPNEDKWSIGQCLDHLVISDCLYFPTFKKITEGTYKMSTWEQVNPFSRILGKMVAQQTQEKIVKKMKTPRIFNPSSSQIDLGIIERFHKHLDSLLEYIGNFRTVNLDQLHITSPVSGFVTYSLRNAITILIPHLHRHINQALRVKALTTFGTT